jgi:hypothetical protein
VGRGRTAGGEDSGSHAPYYQELGAS